VKKKKAPTLRALKARCWKLFSEYVRRKHSDEGGTAQCYTCGELAYWRDLQCGHAIGGRHNAVLFDEEICRPQCVRDNVFLRGNYPIFTTRLIKENGMEWWEAKLAGARQAVKLTRSDLEAKIEEFKQKLKELDELVTSA
jgi:hypothetical protein